MKRNPLLRSILLTCVCLLAISMGTRVMAQVSTTEGSLQAVDAKGQPAGPCPLKHTDVKTEISGFIARVTVTQQFENPFADKIEAVYTFPLPEAAAVDDMKIIVGDRTVKGKIMRREEAQTTYENAKARGQVAALLNQQRPNIFTQFVANILPSQQINVTISYVETLQYEEGSYEWHFPMVVDERYVPAPQSASPPSSTEAQGTAADNPQVPDTEITAPTMPKGMRAGHDVSIEVKIDAGVPLLALRSITHEIEALQPAPNEAVVRLKDQSTIPNKDFVLRYDVAGAQIEDALLFHRDDRDGFFTFILQPPQRVTAADVTPKELVFVLDTSGSMSGFPIEKAKQTMMLALDNLYPQDTFNVILFSGDTRILFSDPQPATAENINKAKKLVAAARGEGGTEMMKAIRAALDPSDALDHVRITCFMTDGQVGDDMEIIAEVQKHPRARVFAMGFGDAPNRFLLDKITQYGRGEVEYVSEKGDTSRTAKHFHDRVRNPLLTDVTIDWNGLPVRDVYPKTIPDLFSAKPVILSGRYTAGGKGVIRLKGMMSGQQFVREIPVELPELESQHDVLGTLWARSKIDELMQQDMAGVQQGKMSDELKTEITNLGLTHRLMTQFTSFVAVDERSPADGVAPRRVDVPLESPDSFSSISCSGVNCTVTVTAASNVVECAVSSTIAQRSLIDLPVNGRSLQSLALMAPGTVPTAANERYANTGVSVNGQRGSSNQFLLDGVNANFGISPGGQAPGVSAGGSAAVTALGDTSAVAPLSAVQEVEIHTYGLNAEYGSNVGGIVNVVTKSGTNNFHGSAFEFFGSHALNANDWFANSRGLARPGSPFNEFGGTLGGPITRDRIFFFTTYEGLRLHLPFTSLTDVPAVAARQSAPAGVQALFNLYPLPNGPARPDGFAEAAAAFGNRGRHDTGTARFDFNQIQKLTFSGYYNFSDSSADERGSRGFSLNTVGRLFERSQMVTGRAAYMPSANVAAELRISYSRLSSRSSYQLDDFGGAVLPPVNTFSENALNSAAGSFAADLNAHNSILWSAADARSTQRQVNVVGAINVVSGSHAMKFGTDYRRVFPIIGLRDLEQSVLFDGVSQALTGLAARVNVFTHKQPQRPIFHSFAPYAEDEWRVTSRLTLNYGLRWELNPAPDLRTSGNLTAVKDVANPARPTFAEPGSRLWATTYGNLAPRFGAAYQLNHDGSFVLRGGFGVLYDTVNNAVGDALADSYPLVDGSTSFNVPFSFALPQSTGTIAAPVSVFDPRLQLPYLLQWNASIDRELGRHQVISVAYVASAGRRLLRTRTLVNAPSDFSMIRLTDNGGESAYQSLQVEFRRRFAKRFAANANYTFGKSVDNVPEDSAARALLQAPDSQVDRGPSDFDVRHTLSGYVSYEPPSPFARGLGRALFRNWTITSVFTVHSAPPVNVVYGLLTTYGQLYLRPDGIADAPAYLADRTAAGGHRINPEAFTISPDFRQGTLGRNALRGFSLTQFDLALRRRFNFTENVRLTVGVEITNVLNHPNFASPSGNDVVLGTFFAPSSFTPNPTFGESFANAAGNSWGVFGSGYYPGGPRALRFSARFEF
jgi:Ca-activated chloride channel family protein